MRSVHPKALRLANALRSAREARGVSQRALAELVGRPQSEISRIETGERSSTPESVAQILGTLRVAGQEYVDIMELTHNIDGATWIPQSMPEQRQHLMALLEVEGSSTHIDHVSPNLFPGLLQDRDYTTAIMKEANLSEAEIVSRTAIRNLRREVILRDDDPVELVSYLCEPALYWIVGSNQIVADQIRHVLQLSTRPNVHVHVVRSRSGWTPALEGAFSLFDNMFVHLENQVSGAFFHGQADLVAYRRALKAVHMKASTEEASREIFVARLAQLEKEQK